MKYFDTFEHISHDLQHYLSKLKCVYSAKKPVIVTYLTFASAPSLMFFVTAPEEKSCN